MFTIVETIKREYYLNDDFKKEFLQSNYPKTPDGLLDFYIEEYEMCNLLDYDDDFEEIELEDKKDFDKWLND